MRDLSYPHLRYFWAVAREGNLTRAARKLHVTQSSVSVQLRKLEESLGTALFERKGRQLQLTRAGRLTLDYADTIFSLGDELLGALEEDAHSAKRTLRVGVLATLSRNFQIGFLDPLVNRSDTFLQVRSGNVVDLLQRLMAHELDVVLSSYVPARDETSAWVVHTIDEQPVSLIGQPTNEWSTWPLQALLTDVPLVVPPLESGIRTAFDSLVERLGIRPQIAAEVDDMAMLRLVTRIHRGLAVIPPIVVKDELETGRLAEHRQLPSLVESFLAITAPRRIRHPLLDELLGAEVHASEV
jgi:LysR family transcriptional activator of nhaA